MDEHLTAELIHLHCPACGQITSLSYGSLANRTGIACPRCGATVPVNIDSVKQEARRKAHELDESVDSLGSVTD